MKKISEKQFRMLNHLTKGTRLNKLCELEKVIKENDCYDFYELFAEVVRINNQELIAKLIRQIRI